MKRLITFAFSCSLLLIASNALAADSDPVFTSYEAGRQALIKGSISDIRKSAKGIAVAADAARQPAIKEKATVLGRSEDLKSARIAFAAISDEVIRYRETRGGDRPIVAYCPMEKKSWLQPDGKIDNPYVAQGMRTCGEVTKK